MVDTTLKICVVPFEIAWGKKEKNIERFKEIIKKVHPETDLLVLPETFSTGFPSDKDKQEFSTLAEPVTGETVQLLKQLSSKYNFAIAGSFLAKDGDTLYNRGFFIEPAGDEYFADKKHLFSLGGEDQVLNTGNKRLSVRYRGWNISMIICYDLRFPVWCRNKNLEYDLLLAVANWPEKRIDAWNTLLKARAMENQAYVCGVNCKGIDNKESVYDGSSSLYNYRGKDLFVKANDDDFLYASLSLKKLNEFRERFTFWKDADKFYLE